MLITFKIMSNCKDRKLKMILSKILKKLKPSKSFPIRLEKATKHGNLKIRKGLWLILIIIKII